MVDLERVAIAGIGLAAFIWLSGARLASANATRFPGCAQDPAEQVLGGRNLRHDDRQADPASPLSDVLWQGVDVSVIDGAVNGTGNWSSRRVQACSGVSRQARCARMLGRSCIGVVRAFWVHDLSR